MPNNSHIDMVARKLREDLGSRAFLTIERTLITEMVRRVSGEPTTRVKRRMAQELQDALIDYGVAVYPRLDETTTGDTVRLYHQGSIVAQLVDLIVYPSPSTDKELGAMILKVKGKWKYEGNGQGGQGIDLRDKGRSTYGKAGAR